MKGTRQIFFQLFLTFEAVNHSLSTAKDGLPVELDVQVTHLSIAAELLNSSPKVATGHRITDNILWDYIIVP